MSAALLQRAQLETKVVTSMCPCRIEVDTEKRTDPPSKFISRVSCREEEVILKGVGEAEGGENPGPEHCKGKVCIPVEDPREEVSNPEMTDGFNCLGIQRPWSQVEGREARSVGKETEPCIQVSS